MRNAERRAAPAPHGKASRSARLASGPALTLALALALVLTLGAGVVPASRAQPQAQVQPQAPAPRSDAYAPARASPPADWVPAPLRAVGFDQRPGAQLPLEARFRDERGASLSLGELLRGRPVLLVPVYFGCPMLCSLVSEGAARAIRQIPFEPGREFDVLVFSFDERDTPEGAAAHEAAFLQRCGDGASADGVAVITGGEAAIAALCGAIGFRFARDEATGQLAHAAGSVVLTPDGRVSRHLLGPEPRPLDLRLALDEAARGELGGVVERALLYCFRWDPARGRYGAAVMNLVRAGGAATLLVLGAFLWRQRRGAAGRAAGRGA